MEASTEASDSRAQKRKSTKIQTKRGQRKSSSTNVKSLLKTGTKIGSNKDINRSRRAPPPRKKAKSKNQSMPVDPTEDDISVETDQESSTSSDGSDSDMDDVNFSQITANHTNNFFQNGGYDGTLLNTPISTPISPQINKKLKNKIWSDAYIDMADLLPMQPSSTNTNQFTLQINNFASNNVSLAPSHKPRKIFNIETWTTAFLRFVAVYSEKFPYLTAALMKYAEVVRDISTRRPGLAWQNYDTQFRLLKSQMGMPWDTMHYELWLKACTDPTPYTQSSPRPFRSEFPSNRRWNKPKPSQPLSKFWPNTCWPYNRQDCRSTNCTLPHVCGFCKGTHHAGQCHYRNREHAAQSLLGQNQGKQSNFTKPQSVKYVQKPASHPH
ncbi:uncharacterized protein LOC132728591 [Ruditapes philippinarum]|uniref:uncharacterized protein LOC132728591 n=1 Tax=Ruditapes philippinarum TaxID=129788 RepID=UPI00295BE23E|nr:uncharacterized protein LOC132728591 [Ruditapes philippinarum]